MKNKLKRIAKKLFSRKTAKFTISGIIIIAITITALIIPSEDVDAATLYGTLNSSQRLEIDYSYSTSGSTTTITWKLYCNRTSTAWKTWKASTPTTVKIAGTTVFSGNTYFDVRSGRKLLKSGTKAISRSNGAAKSVAMYAYVNLSGCTPGSLTLSSSITLPAYTSNTNVTATVQMSDDNDQDGMRPSSVTVNLLRNGAAYTTADLAITGDTQTVTFSSVPAYSGGTAYTYTVTGADVTGYTSAVSGKTITYTHVPSVRNISGTVQWDDNNDQSSIRPESFDIELMKDGIVIATRTVSEATNWTYDFGSYNSYELGTLINYTIEPVSLINYTYETLGTSIIAMVVQEFDYHIGFGI